MFLDRLIPPLVVLLLLLSFLYCNRPFQSVSCSFFLLFSLFFSSCPFQCLSGSLNSSSCCPSFAVVLLVLQSALSTCSLVVLPLVSLLLFSVFLFLLSFFFSSCASRSPPGSLDSSCCCPSSSIWRYSCCYKSVLSFHIWLSLYICSYQSWLKLSFLCLSFHFFFSLSISSCEFFTEQFVCGFELKVFVAVEYRTLYCLHGFTFTVGVVRVCSRLRLRWSPNVSSAADAKSAKLSTRVACTNWGLFSAGTNAVRRLLKLKWSICLTFLKISSMKNLCKGSFSPIWDDKSQLP